MVPLVTQVQEPDGAATKPSISFHSQPSEVKLVSLVTASNLVSKMPGALVAPAGVHVSGVACGALNGDRRCGRTSRRSARNTLVELDGLVGGRIPVPVFNLIFRTVRDSLVVEDEVRRPSAVTVPVSFI